MRSTDKGNTKLLNREPKILLRNMNKSEIIPIRIGWAEVKQVDSPPCRLLLFESHCVKSPILSPGQVGQEHQETGQQVVSASRL